METRLFGSSARAVLTAGLAGVGVTGVVLTLVGFLGAVWWPFDVVASFRPQYAVLLAIVAALWGAAIGRAPALVFLAGSLVNVVVVLPLFLASPAPASGGAELTIVSFNVGASNPNRTDVVRWLGNTGADLLFIHESSRDWEDAVRRSGIGYDIVASPSTTRTFGITVLAREEVTARVVPVGADEIAVVEVERDRATLTVIGVHPRAPVDGASARARDDLLAAVADRARAVPGPVVVVGDLNATPWSHAFRSLARDGDLVDSLRGYGLQPTWPADRRIFAVPIDHVLHSPDLTTTARSTGPALGSDHRPVLATIGFAG